MFLLWCPWVWKLYKFITADSGFLHNKALALRDKKKGILYKRHGRLTYSRTLNILQQGRQCTYNVILGRVLATIVEMEKKWILHLSVYICSFGYPACNAHASYCHAWPVPLYNIFPHYLINGTILETTIFNKNMCFGFLYNFVWNNFHSKNNCVRYDQKCILVLM